MANQHTSMWSDETEAALIVMREDEDRDWSEVNAALDLPHGSKAAKDKYRRIVNDRRRYAELREIIADEAKVEYGAGEAVCSCYTSGDRWTACCGVDQVREDDEEEFTVSEHVTALDYEYDEAARVYRFPVLGKLISVTEDNWTRVLRLYSGDGANLSQHEIAMQLGVSKKQLEAMIRAYGHFKARPPVSREALARGESMESLAGEAIEVKERKFLKVLRERSAKQMETELRKLKQELHDRGEAKEELRGFVQEMIASLGGYARPAVKIVPTHADEVFDAHSVLFDPHLGLATHSEMGWTNDYSSDTAVEYIRTQGRLSAQRIANRRGQCRTTYFSMGGDFFHAPLGRTESGRPLMRDKPDRMLFRLGCEAVIDYIESLRQVSGNVIVKGIGGNHGHVFDELLVDFIAMYYRDCPDVSVDESMQTRAWFRTGTVLHVIDHGTTFSTVTSERSLSRADRIARIIAGREYHGVTRVIFYVGHMHHRESKSQSHMEIIRVPVFCHESDYEDFLGFYNDPMADLYFLDAQGRIDATERLYLVDEMPFESKLSA